MQRPAHTPEWVLLLLPSCCCCRPLCAHQSYQAASTICGLYDLYISPSVGFLSPLGTAHSSATMRATSAASAAWAQRKQGNRQKGPGGACGRSWTG